MDRLLGVDHLDGRTPDEANFGLKETAMAA
jgi:hypothetical protein